jgi:hypothetical protein
MQPRTQHSPTIVHLRMHVAHRNIKCIQKGSHKYLQLDAFAKAQDFSPVSYSVSIDTAQGKASCHDKSLFIATSLIDQCSCRRKYSLNPDNTRTCNVTHGFRTNYYGNDGLTCVGLFSVGTSCYLRLPPAQVRVRLFWKDLDKVQEFPITFIDCPLWNSN